MSSYELIGVRTAVGFVGAVLFTFAAISHAAPEHSSAVTGTGGSSSARVLAQWNFAFMKETGINVGFAAANSDVGIREAIAHRTDFANTEIPLAAEDLTKNDLVQFP